MSIAGTKKEYLKIDMLSASDLRLFITDRKKFFKKKILKEEEPEEYNRAVLIGNLCHTMLFEPETFDKKYLMSMCSEPPTGLMLAFTEALFRHSMANTNQEGVVTADSDVLIKAAYEESGFKISQDAVMKKFLGSNAEEYYKELRESKSKNLTVVCTADLEIANSIIERVKNDEFIGAFFSKEADNYEIFHEIQVEDVPLLGMKMKAMLDKIIVDHEKKRIQLYDLKVVWDNQNFYMEYYLKKFAYIQAFTYYSALFCRKIDLGFDYSDYLIEYPIFVVVDSSNFYAPLRYKLSEKDMENALEGFEEKGRRYPGIRDVIEDLVWAQETGNWGINRKAWQNDGLVDLK